MISKYIFGNPYYTEAVVEDIDAARTAPKGIDIAAGQQLVLTRPLTDSTAVYGLGQNVRGINKRGYVYTSFCTDIAGHTETTSSLYGAHNFVIFRDEELLGVFVDFPGKVTFDLGFERGDRAVITVDGSDAVVYLITGDSLMDITTQFRRMTGKSYVPPKWGFGYQQSRWGYKTAEDVRQVVRQSKAAGCPLDAVCLDIDYMEDFKDFTVSRERFGGYEGLAALSAELKGQGVRLVPIIDAGVKVDENYDVYTEGRDKGYFCRDGEGKPFVAAVWPGRSVFPDVLNPEARRWFGGLYKRLLDCGIEGFWNDMNEPSIFYTPAGLNAALAEVDSVRDKNVGIYDYFRLLGVFNDMSRRPEDLKAFYHNTPQGAIAHYGLHNLFGFNMTRAAHDAFRRTLTDRRILLYSRASSIGMHRCAGLWTGDNCSWWSHLLLNIKMMPSLNMCGFLYSGADIGGFGSDATEDLVMRWLQFGIFTPLMRNHSAWDTRPQEVYRFRLAKEMAGVVTLRYRLLPYLYSEYLKAVNSDGMLFRPLAFDYPSDRIACRVEDQLMWGESVMLAPVYEQNAAGRYVYLPEDMLCVRFRGAQTVSSTPMPAGHHYVDIPLTELVIFVRRGQLLPLGDPAECTDRLSGGHLELIGWGSDTMTCRLLDDDGVTLSGIASRSRAITVRRNGTDWQADDSQVSLRIE